MLGHASGGAAHTRARWKRLPEHAAPWALGFPGKSWLPALWLDCAAISGSPPGRGGPGDHVGPGVQLPSIGKKGRAKPSLGSPAQHSTAAQHRNPSSGLPNPLLHSRAATSMGPLQPSNKDTLRAHPASTQGTKAVPGAGERRAARSILRHTTCTDRGSGQHRCLEKPGSARAPSYQPSPGEPTGWRQRGSSPTPCPSGSTRHRGEPAPFAESRQRSRPPGELGRAIRPGRAPEMGDSISRHGETPHPGSLTSSRLRASGGQCLPHGHHAGGAPGWHNPSWGSQGGTKPYSSPGAVLPAPGAPGP